MHCSLLFIASLFPIITFVEEEPISNFTNYHLGLISESSPTHPIDCLEWLRGISSNLSKPHTIQNVNLRQQILLPHQKHWYRLYIRQNTVTLAAIIFHAYCFHISCKWIIIHNPYGYSGPSFLISFQNVNRRKKNHLIDYKQKHLLLLEWKSLKPLYFPGTQNCFMIFRNHLTYTLHYCQQRYIAAYLTDAFIITSIASTWNGAHRDNLWQHPVDIAWTEDDGTA